MSHPIDIAGSGLLKRANALKNLVDKGTDARTSVSLQSAYAALRGSAGLVIELEDQAYSQSGANASSTKSGKRPSRQFHELLAQLIVVDRYQMIVNSAVLLAQGKDVEAIKHIGQEVLKTVISLGITVSGVKALKDTAEVVKTLEELARTGQSFQFRKKQVQQAAKLMKWIEAIVITNIAWSYAAQRFLCDISGNRSATDQEVIDLVLKRMVQCSRDWHS